MTVNWNILLLVMKRTDGQMLWNLYLLLKMKKVMSICAKKDQYESSDDKPMRINVQDKLFITLRREGNSYHLLILPPNITPIVADRSPHDYFFLCL